MKYCIAKNTGKGFFTHQDSLLYNFKNFFDIWVLKDNIGDVDWIKRVNGIEKTKDEAQALLDAEILKLQNEWDLNNPNITEEDEIYLTRPIRQILP